MSYLNRLSDEWMAIKELVVYGLGIIGRRNIGKLCEDFEIPFIIDNGYSKGGGANV